MMYDVVVIGAGPAGLSAALYTSRNGYRTLILDKGLHGGTLNETEIIDNYVGSISYNAEEIANKMLEDATNYGASFLPFSEVTDITIEDDRFYKVFYNDTSVISKSIILASGTSHNHIEILENYPNVSYCALCDAPFYKDKPVLVVGAGDTAFESALYLSKYASSVHIIQRNDNIRANQSLQDLVLENEKIKIVLNTELDLIEFDETNKVFKVNIFNTPVEFSGIFPCIGSAPETKYLRNIGLDKGDYLTHIAKNGVFTAGDLNNPDFRQVSIAVGEGAKAALHADRYLKKLYNNFLKN